MSVLTVCKNVIGANNKRGWKEPTPPIRLANTVKGNARSHGFYYAIVDKRGEIVASIESTKDGAPIVKCGAKVAIITRYPARKVS